MLQQFLNSCPTLRAAANSRRPKPSESYFPFSHCPIFATAQSLTFCHQFPCSVPSYKRFSSFAASLIDPWRPRSFFSFLVCSSWPPMFTRSLSSATLVLSSRYPIVTHPIVGLLISLVNWLLFLENWLVFSFTSVLADLIWRY